MDRMIIPYVAPIITWPFHDRPIAVPRRFELYGVDYKIIDGPYRVPAYYNDDGSCPVTIATLFEPLNPYLSRKDDPPGILRIKRKVHRPTRVAQWKMMPKGHLTYGLFPECYFADKGEVARTVSYFVAEGVKGMPLLSYIFDGEEHVRNRIIACFRRYPDYLASLARECPSLARLLVIHNYVVRHRHTFVSVISDFVNSSTDKVINAAIIRQRGFRGKLLVCRGDGDVGGDGAFIDVVIHA